MTALDNAPSHWKRTTIGEIADVRLGRQRSPKNHSGDQMRPYLRAANVTRYRLRPDDIKQMNFTDEEMETYALEENDIVVVEGGTPEGVGECALVSGKFAGHAFQNTLIRVRVGAGVDPRWMMLRLNADCELGGYSEIAQGAGNIQHLSAMRYKSHPLHLPPLEEQRQIADDLERMMSRVTAGTRGLMAVRATTDLALRVCVDDLISGTRTVPLRELLREPMRNGRSVPDGDGAAVLRLGALRGDVVDTTDAKPGRWGETDAADYYIQPGDRLVARGNGTLSLVGRSSRVPEGVRDVAFPDTVIRLRLDSSYIDPLFFDEVWQSVAIRHQIESQARTTSGIYKINQTILAGLQVPLPVGSAQREILETATRRRTVLRRLRSTSHAVEARAPSLRRSILKAAFEGRLTSHDVRDATPDDIEEALAS